MNVNPFILAANPFFEAYVQSDFLGKIIFLALFAVSIASWSVLIYKFWSTKQAQKNAHHFYETFIAQKFNPLALDADSLNKKKMLNPFLELYSTLKKHCVELLTKNKHFGLLQRRDANLVAYLSLSDIDLIASHLTTSTAYQVKDLEKNLYILSTTVSLSPFLGLLGTVWGILTTFNEMQSQTMGNSHQAVLSGLSLALATTVLGLINAIPALVGYNYLKNDIRNFTTEMEGFSNEMLATVELQYRKVEEL